MREIVFNGMNSWEFKYVLWKDGQAMKRRLVPVASRLSSDDVKDGSVRHWEGWTSDDDTFSGGCVTVVQR